jgi:uncharacterized protein YciI
VAFFLVVLTRSGEDYDHAQPLEKQRLFDEHAEFMDGLVTGGLMILGGPLSDERRVVYALEARSEEDVRERLARDPWSGSHLEIASIDPWTIRLDGR